VIEIWTNNLGDLQLEKVLLEHKDIFELPEQAYAAMKNARSNEVLEPLGESNFAAASETTKYNLPDSLYSFKVSVIFNKIAIDHDHKFGMAPFEDEDFTIRESANMTSNYLSFRVNLGNAFRLIMYGF